MLNGLILSIAGAALVRVCNKRGYTAYFCEDLAVGNSNSISGLRPKKMLFENINCLIFTVCVPLLSQKYTVYSEHLTAWQLHI